MKKLGIAAIVIGVIAAIIGIIMKFKERAAIGIIGGADGPTSVLVASRVGNGIGFLGMFFGILLLIIGAWLIFKNK